MRDTTIDWLFKQISKIEIMDPAAGQLYEEICNLKKQAKSKEKRLLKDTYKKACWFREQYDRVNVSVAANDYYEETFKP